MPRPDRIVLCGSFGSGKTSISDQWARIVGGAALSFAEPIRYEVAAGLANAEIRGDREETAGNRIRQHLSRMTTPDTKDAYRGILQEWGKFRTNQDERYWVSQFEREYFHLVASDAPMSCGDCRLENQMELLKSWDFTFVRLEDGPYVRDQGERQNDETESHWPNWEYDYVLDFQEGVEHQARRLIDEVGLTRRG